MTINNYNYQSTVESHKRLQELAIGDEMLIRVHPNRFSMELWKGYINVQNNDNVMITFFFCYVNIGYNVTYNVSYAI